MVNTNFIYKNLHPALSIIKYKINFFLKNNNKINYNLSIEENKVLHQIKKNGYALIHDYISLEDCKLLIDYINATIEKHPNLIWQDKIQSDSRIFGAEKISDKFDKFFNDKYIQKICEKYCNYKVQNLMTMANKVIFKESNTGSGGGWHKDAYYNQFKSILYLNDVSDDNGPFQFIKRSNKFLNALNIAQKLKKGYPNTRFTNEEIMKSFSSSQIETLNAKAGSLILVDTSLIHRGKPITNGLRYALTNYFMPKNRIEDMKDKFHPRFSLN